MSDLKFAFRQLLKNPGFTAVAVLILALGIGVNTAAFSLVEAVLLRPLPFPESQQLVELYQSNLKHPMRVNYGVSMPDFSDWQAQSRSFSKLGIDDSGNFRLEESGQVRAVRGGYVTAGLLEAAGARPTWGRLFSKADERTGGVAIVGFKLWQRLFGADTNLAGKRVVVNAHSEAVAGVMPPGFDFPSGGELWMPLLESKRDTKPLNQRGWPTGCVYGRLKPGISIRQAQAEMEAVGRRLAQQYPDDKDWGVGVVSLHRRLTAYVRPTLFILAGVAAFVLLIACANLGGLLLCRAVARQKEFAIRASVGAGRWRLVRQLLTESVLLSALGGLAGLLAVLWCHGLFARLPAPLLPRFAVVRVDAPVFLFSMLVALLTGMLCGLASAWRVRRGQLYEVLKEGGQRTPAERAGSWLRSGLVVTELALATVLLIAAGLGLRSVYYLLHPGLKVHLERVLTFDVNLPNDRYPTAAQRLAFFNTLLARIKTLPNVQAVGADSGLDFGGGGGRVPILAEGAPTKSGGPARYAWSSRVTPGYFRTLGLPLLCGRGICAQDREGTPPVAVINQTMAREYWPGQDPIGKRFILNVPGNRGPWMPVVGVVGDLRRGGLQNRWRPEYYQSACQDPFLHSVVVRVSRNPEAMAGQLRSLLRGMDNSLPEVSVGRLDRVLYKIAGDAPMLGWVLFCVAGLALALAVVGVYGVIAYTVAQRTHEFGLRMALGARRGDILLLVLRWGGSQAVFGAALGLLVGWCSTRFMKGMLHGVSPTDLLTFSTVALLLVVVSLLAALLPARRAAKADPMEALRYE